MHPESLSMPMTCTNTHDLLFHVLYGKNTGMIAEFVHASACRLYSITSCQQLGELAHRLATDVDSVSADRLRAIFFLLLNVDMQLKEYVCDTGSMGLFAAALNLSDADAASRHRFSLVGTSCIAPDRMKHFIVQLREVSNTWLSNETLTCSDFVRKVKSEYLVC